MPSHALFHSDDDENEGKKNETSKIFMFIFSCIWLRFCVVVCGVTFDLILLNVFFGSPGCVYYYMFYSPVSRIVFIMFFILFYFLQFIHGWNSIILPINDEEKFCKMMTRDTKKKLHKKIRIEYSIFERSKIVKNSFYCHHRL